VHGPSLTAMVDDDCCVVANVELIAGDIVEGAVYSLEVGDAYHGGSRDKRPPYLS
jgi:hypothetical protein